MQPVDKLWNHIKHYKGDWTTFWKENPTVVAKDVEATSRLQGVAN